MKEVRRYEGCICPVDASILNADKYCFSVLMRILGYECRLTLTDGERLIICYSAHPYPVWVWLPDDAGEDELERAYKLVRESFGFSSGYRYNIKYAHADYFIRRAGEDGESLSITANMHAYTCDTPIEPQRSRESHLRRAKEGEIELVTRLIDEFHREASIDKTNMQTYRKRARDLIADGCFYLLIDGAGEVAASCTLTPQGAQAAIGSVYTLPTKRRQGHAARMVCEATRLAIEMGKTPVLYTDADYPASNACYTSIGYKRMGSLCTIS